MDNLQPVLLGWNVKELWDYIHPIALAGWFILCVAPRWSYTYTITLIPPLIHAVLYASILLPLILFPDQTNPTPQIDIADMESVFHAFGVPNIFFCGWVHYLAFDLLVARGLAMDAVVTCNVSYLTYYILVVPCLLATLYVGPVGYLAYMILRSLVLFSPQSMTKAHSKEAKVD
jgi:Domain of unknown function (DUF4281)